MTTDTPPREDAAYRVLLVEDSDSDALLLGEALRRSQAWRFEVQHVSRLVDAIAALEKGDIELVALDLGLPDSAGRESFDRVHDRFPEIPIIALTGGTADPRLGAELVKSGAQDFLVKGAWDPGFVASAFRYAIERGRVERSLRAAEEQAMSAGRAKSAFLAAMSHEIRTPLTAILGMADLLLETRLDEEQSSYVETFQRCGHGLLGLLNNVLDLSRIDAGQLQCAPADFDITETTEDIGRMFAYAAHRKGISMAIDVDGCGTVRADIDRLRQVLTNLIGNAVKFTHEGGVSLRVTVTGEGSEGRLAFEVGDTGIGMSPEEASGVFQRFTQANETIQRRFGGSGLGLTLSAELVELMGGDLSVESTEGLGSTFRFEVPAYVHPDEGDDETSLLRGTKILVADDSDEERASLRRMLVGLGAGVVECSDAASAIEKLTRQDSNFDFVILDARMPGGGFAVMDMLKERTDPGPEISIALPMDHRPGDRPRIRRLGGHALSKPIRRKDALAWITGRTREEAIPSPLDVSALGKLEVLLVDDSADNRALIAAFLRPTEWNVDIAVNGAEALERIAAKTYDIALMDMQMPVLDGYSATQKLREIEKAEGLPHLAVLALTADAMPENRDRALGSGCDGYLSKPLTREALLQSIRAVVKMPEAESAEETPLTLEIEPELLDLVPGYLENRRSDIESFRAALDSADWDVIRRLGHNMKGSGSGYGFPEITRLGREIETAAKGHTPEAVRQSVESLGRYLDEVDTKLETLLLADEGRSRL